MFKKKSKKSKESNTKSAYGNPQQSSYQPPPYLPGPQQQQQQKPPSQYQQAGQAQAPPQQYQPQQLPQYKPQPQKQQKAPAGRPQTPPQQYQPQQQQQRSPSPNSRSSSQSSGGKKSKSKQKSQYSQDGYAPQQQPGQQQQYGQQQGQHNGRQQHGQQQYGQGAPPGGYQQQGAGFGGGGYAAGGAPMGAYIGGGGYGGGGVVNGGMAGGGMAGPVVPNGPPPAGLEVLNAVDCIVVNQHMEPLEILTGYETANRYSLHTAMGHPVYYAAEESSEMGRQFAGANRQFLMHIFDNMGREVMRLHRPSLLFTGGGFLSCEAPPGCQIGGVNRFDGMFNRGYQVMSVFGNPVFTVAREVNMVALTTPHQPFTIRNMAGVQVGAITKQYGGVLKEVHTDADTFFVNFPAQMEVQLKALLVAATFLIDYMEFENNQPDRDGTMNNYMGPRGGGMGYGMGYGMGMGYGYGGGFY